MYMGAFEIPETRTSLQAIRFLEHQIMALDNEWLKFEKKTFIDWNHKFN